MFGIYLQITSHVKKQENMIQDEETESRWWKCNYNKIVIVELDGGHMTACHTALHLSCVIKVSPRLLSNLANLLNITNCTVRIGEFYGVW